MPTGSSGLIRNADTSIINYIPVGTSAVTTYNQVRTNQFDAALDSITGDLYAINVPEALYNQPYVVFCVKNEQLKNIN